MRAPHELTPFEPTLPLPSPPPLQVSYRSYWTRQILEVLRDSRPASMSIKDISEATAIKTEDVVRTLESLSLIKVGLKVPEGREGCARGMKERRRERAGRDEKFWGCDIEERPVCLSLQKWSSSSPPDRQVGWDSGKTKRWLVVMQGGCGMCAWK